MSMLWPVFTHYLTTLQNSSAGWNTEAVHGGICDKKAQVCRNANWCMYLLYHFV